MVMVALVRTMIVLLVAPTLVAACLLMCAPHGRSEQAAGRWPATERANLAAEPVAQPTEHLPSKDNSSSANQNATTSDELCDFNGQSLRIAVSPQPPFVDCLQDLFGEWMCNGSNIEVIRVLEQRLNFKSSWVVLANSHHEDHLETMKISSPSKGASRWRDRKKETAASGANDRSKELEAKSAPQPTGLFGLVGSGRVLLGANGFMKTLDRRDENIIISEPFDSFRLHFLLSKSVRDHEHIFVKPFTLNAWLAILASAASVVPMLYLLNTTSYYYSLLDDRHLRGLSLKSCLRFAGQRLQHSWRAAKKCKRKRGSRSLSSSSSSSELSLEEVLNGTSLATKFGPSNQKNYSNNLPLVLQTTQVHGEARRQRRLARRKWALERRRARRLGRKQRVNARSGFSSLAYIVWYVVASLANQGGETEDLPKANSTRMLIAFWWLYLIVICAIHSGILTAILTFPKQNDFIQTLDDFLNLESNERASLRLSVDKYSELAHLLADADNLHKSPLQQLIQNNGANRANDRSPGSQVGMQTGISYVNFERHKQRILDEVQQGRAAFMEEKSTIVEIITQEYFDSKQSKCLFKASRYPIDVIPMSLLMSKKLPKQCVRSINLTLRRIAKTGLAQKWRRKFESSGNDCLNSVIINAGDVDKIELKHVVLAFWLLSLGLVVGLLGLLGEIAWLFLVEDESDDEEATSGDDSSLDTFKTRSSDESSSGDSDRVQLGFRRAQVATMQGSTVAPGFHVAPSAGHVHGIALATGHHQQVKMIRSLRARGTQLKSIMRRMRRQQKGGPIAAKASLLAPELVLTLSPSIGMDLDADILAESEHQLRLNADEIFPTLQAEFQARRALERRRRREAKLAQRRNRRVQKTVDFLKHLHSGRIYTKTIKTRMRRVSTVFAGHFGGQHTIQPQPTPVSHSLGPRVVASPTDNCGAQRATIRRRRGTSTGGRVAPSE